MTRKNRFRLLSLLLFLPASAQAATGTVGLSTILSTFQSVTQGWYHTIFTDALGLIGALFSIEVIWLVVTWLIGGKDVHEIFSSFIKKLLTIGFFYTVLESSAQWVPWLIGGFKNVAVSAGGEPITTVGDLVMTGIRAFVLCIEGGPVSTASNTGAALSDLWNLNLSGAATALGNAASSAVTSALGVNLLAGIIVGFILLLSFTYVVLELVAVQMEGMIVLSVGVIMLGFGGARWTARFVESYLQYALAVGVRLMVITLWASFIEWQVNPLIKSTLINGNASMEAYAIVLILALLIAWLTKKLPGFASSILSGQSTLSGGEMYDAVKKGTLAAAAVVTGGAALAAGAAGVAGVGAMGAAEGAAGSAGAGSLSAGQAGISGASDASRGVPAPSGDPASASAAGNGVPAPSGSPAPAQATGGKEAPAGGSPSHSAPSGSKGVPAPSGDQASAPSSSNGAPAHSGSPAPSSGTVPAPSGSPAPASGSAPSGDPASAPAAGGKDAPAPSSSKGVPAPSAPDASTPEGSPLDLAKDVMQRVSDLSDLQIGDHARTGVSAPGLGVKHLSD